MAIFIEGLLERFIRPNQQGTLDASYRAITTALAKVPDEQVGHVALIAMASMAARILVLGEDEASAKGAALRLGSQLLLLARSAHDANVDPKAAGYELIISWIAEN